MAIAYLLSTLCTYHVEAYGMDEKRDLFGFDTLFFGGIACLCCAIFYIFNQNNTIAQLRVQVTEKNKNIDVLETKIREQRAEIGKKTLGYHELYKQLLSKEKKEKTFALSLKNEKRRCTKLMQRCIGKSKKIKRMRYLHSIQHQQDTQKIK